MEQWAIVELMGHVRLGGFVTEEEQFGVKMGRIDIHGPNGAIATQYFGGTSVYRITPTTEEIANAVARNTPAPVQAWELPPRRDPIDAAEREIDASFTVQEDEDL